MTSSTTHTRSGGSLRRRIAVGVASALAIGVGSVVATTATAAPASAATCRSYTYSSGGVSTCISYIQQMLNWQIKALGLPAAQLKVDGAFGPATKAAVVAYQRNTHLTADGIVGPNTWRVLCNDLRVGGAGFNRSAWLKQTGYPVAAHNAAGCSPW